MLNDLVESHVESNLDAIKADLLENFVSSFKIAENQDKANDSKKEERTGSCRREDVWSLVM